VTVTSKVTVTFYVVNELLIFLAQFSFIQHIGAFVFCTEQCLFSAPLVDFCMIA
jgi:hypothetical protein